MNIAFLLTNRYFPRKFAESAAKGSQTLNQRWSSVETQHFVVCDIWYIHVYIWYMYDIYDIYMIYMIYIYIIYIYIVDLFFNLNLVLN